MAACNADLCRQASAFGAHRVLDDLDHDGAALEHLLFNRHQGLARTCSGITVCMLLPHIGHMQEGGFVQANVNES